MVKTIAVISRKCFFRCWSRNGRVYSLFCKQRRFCDDLCEVPARYRVTDEGLKKSGDFKCQYCNIKFKASELTFDHVVSRAKGGLSNWDNVVSACFKCNNKKGSLSYKDANMKLVKTPKKPTFIELRQAGKLFPPNYLHHTWNDFLYWDSVLEIT